jgi:hypothetical protein
VTSKGSRSIFDQVLSLAFLAEKQRRLDVLQALKMIDVKPGKQVTRKATAHHEAGHVVLGVSVGRKLKAGVKVGDDSEVEFWARSDRDDGRRKERIRIAIAGPIAEANYAGSSAGGGSDLPLALKLARQLTCAVAKKRTVLSELSEEVRATLEIAPVKELAAAILRTGSLSKKELLAELANLHWPT